MPPRFLLIVSVLGAVLVYVAVTTSFTILVSSSSSSAAAAAAAAAAGVQHGVTLATTSVGDVNCSTMQPQRQPHPPPSPGSLESARSEQHPARAGDAEEIVESYLTVIADPPDAPAPIKAAAAYMQHRKTNEACDLAAAKKVASWDKNDGQRRDVGICFLIRNDAALLDEFIAFHWLQGVGHFTIYDDNSQDDPWSVLQKYADLGIVEFHDLRGHPHSGTIPLQTDTLNGCLTDLRARYAELGLRWLAFTDIDEFILSNNKDQLLTELLNDKYRDVACMEIGRTYYGTSFYHRRPPNGSLITETYLLASPDYADGYPKMIANIYPDGNYSMNATKLYSVHNFWWQHDIPCRWQQQIRDIRINHYMRSLEDYERKILTGYKEVNRHVSNPLEIFWERDRNERLTPIAADYACRVHALIEVVREMEETGKIPRVAVRPTPWNETQTEPPTVPPSPKLSEQEETLVESPTTGVDGLNDGSIERDQEPLQPEDVAAIANNNAEQGKTG